MKRGICFYVSFLLLVFGEPIFATQASVDAPEQQETEEAAAEAIKAEPDSVLEADLTEGEEEKVTVYVIPVKDVIDKPILYILRRGLKEAIANDIDAIVLDMDTPGGRMDIMLEIMEMMDRFEGDTATYVNPDAISAGAYIAASTKAIYFSNRQAAIGAAEVVSSTGEDINESMKRKVDSYLRAKVRSMTEEYPYRGDVMRAMMDSDFVFEVDGQVLKAKGELLTLTASEAMKEYGEDKAPLLGAGIHNDLESLLISRYGEKGYELKEFEVSWSEEFAQYMSKVIPIMMGLGMLLLFVEFKTPGFGLFGILGISLLLIGFGGNYVAGLAGNEALIFLFIGIIFIAVELFFFPGTMIFMVMGLFLILGSMIWSLADIWPTYGDAVSDFDFSVLWPAFKEMVLALFVAVVGGVILWRFLPKSSMAQRLVLAETSADPSTVISGGGSSFSGQTELPEIGATGVVLSDLHPSGMVEIRGHRFEAKVDVGTLSKGEAIIVIGYRNFYLAVAKNIES
ncbi:MAG: ATP-dependent Clp protease proteolytic subunit [Opitutaceae bacterium]|nr:ATP-dependent Clp protease proteolytic subunit [Opitutaceae bacterium]